MIGYRGSSAKPEEHREARARQDAFNEAERQEAYARVRARYEIIRGRVGGEPEHASEGMSNEEARQAAYARVRARCARVRAL